MQPFHRSIRKQQRTNPKFYFFDTGVKRALDRTLEVNLVEKTFAFADAFEHFVIIEIIRTCSYLKPDWRFSYLQTGAGAEIDLIIDRPGDTLLLIEIKSTTECRPEHVKVLSDLQKDIPKSLGYCISRDKRKKKIQDISCMHWQDFLKLILK